MSYFLVFLLQDRSSCIVPASSAIGDPEVGDIAKIRWEGRIYKVKVLYSGPKELCELKFSSVTTDGELREDLFEVSFPHYLADSPNWETAKARAVGSLDGIEENISSIKEMMIKMYSLVVSLSERMDKLEEMTAELLRRVPKKHTERPIDYTYVSEEDVAALRILKAENRNGFALALEAMVYRDDPTDLQLPVDKRTRSSDRVIFIKNCVLKYYEVPEAMEWDVWTSVKTALNSRVRRLRKELRDREAVPIA
ncbi:hypothetical protein GCK32_008530 [Trichostrongylus colubriformis]|uniref:Uncharacterized protein n=1 Tax=Trichostrongylus colubriformis TaxID=6319 RepID=A0AAN8ER39_TRICO